MINMCDDRKISNSAKRNSPMVYIHPYTVSGRISLDLSLARNFPNLLKSSTYVANSRTSKNFTTSTYTDKANIDDRAVKAKRLIVLVVSKITWSNSLIGIYKATTIMIVAIIILSKGINTALKLNFPTLKCKVQKSNTPESRAEIELAKPILQTSSFKITIKYTLNTIFSDTTTAETMTGVLVSL